MNNPRFVNLTPHPITIVNGPTVAPSGQLARCASQSVPAGEHGGVALSRVTFGAVEGLPDPEPGVLYIVSALVRAAIPTRSDVASPGDLCRDEKGAVIGCKGLTVN